MLLCQVKKLFEDLKFQKTRLSELKKKVCLTIAQARLHKTVTELVEPMFKPSYPKVIFPLKHFITKPLIIFIIFGL